MFPNLKNSKKLIEHNMGYSQINLIERTREKGEEEETEGEERNLLRGVWGSGATGQKSGRGVCIFSEHLRVLLMQEVPASYFWETLAKA